MADKKLKFTAISIQRRPGDEKGREWSGSIGQNHIKEKHTETNTWEVTDRKAKRPVDLFNKLIKDADAVIDEYEKLKAILENWRDELQGGEK